MPRKEFPVAYFFNSSDDVAARKKVFDRYVKKFDTQLFKLEEDHKEVKINYLGRSEEEYEKADGLFIGEHL